MTLGLDFFFHGNHMSPHQMTSQWPSLVSLVCIKPNKTMAITSNHITMAISGFPFYGWKESHRETLELESCHHSPHLPPHLIFVNSSSNWSLIHTNKWKWKAIQFWSPCKLFRIHSPFHIEFFFYGGRSQLFLDYTWFFRFITFRTVTLECA